MHAHGTDAGTSRFIQLLFPSVLSGLVSIGVPILCMSLTVVLTRIQGALLYDGLTTLPRAAFYDYLNIANRIDHSVLINDASLFVFWAVIGAAVYLAALQLLKIVVAAVSLERQIQYVHVNRYELLWDVIFRLSIRLLDGVGLYVLILYTVRNLIPHALAAARAVSVYPFLGYIYQAIFVTLLLIASLLLQTVLLRLFVFRTRVFGT